MVREPVAAQGQTRPTRTITREVLHSGGCGCRAHRTGGDERREALSWLPMLTLTLAQYIVYRERAMTTQTATRPATNTFTPADMRSCPRCRQPDALIALGLRYDHPHRWRPWVMTITELYLCDRCEVLVAMGKAQEPVVADARRGWGLLSARHGDARGVPGDPPPAMHDDSHVRHAGLDVPSQDPTVDEVAASAGVATRTGRARGRLAAGRIRNGHVDRVPGCGCDRDHAFPAHAHHRRDVDGRCERAGHHRGGPMDLARAWQLQHGPAHELGEEEAVDRCGDGVAGE